MFKTTEEGLTVYKAELVAYKKHLDELKKSYNEEELLIHNLGGGDYRHLTEWGDRLRAMEEVLGMTRDEIAVAQREVGIPS